MKPVTLEPNNLQPSALKQAQELQSLLQINQHFKAFLVQVKNLHGRYFVTDSLPEKEPWQTLLNDAEQCLKQLERAPKQAEQLLGSAITSGLKKLSYVASVIRAWPQHAKRNEMMQLLASYAVDPRIMSAIDEALIEDSGALLGLMNLDLKAELIVMLEAQVDQFVSQLELLKLASTRQEQERTLAQLLPDQPDAVDTIFDPFAMNLMSVNDIELTLVAIVVLALLKHTPL